MHIFARITLTLSLLLLFSLPSLAVDWSEFPVPPQQHAPWTPPETELPASFISATQRLFELGFPDPRGCEYCIITVQYSDPTWGIRKSTTCGWLLPPTPGIEQRFAICWDGLIYPVTVIGKPVSLKDDINESSSRLRIILLLPSGFDGHDDHATMNHNQISTLRSSLLLRLGEGELACRFWPEEIRTSGESYDAGNTDKDDPFLILAADWFWAMLDRATGSHISGDDRLALAYARMLAEIQPAIEKEAEQRGFQHLERRIQHDDRMDEWIADKPFFPFIEPLPGLLVDQEYRQAHPRPPDFSVDAILAEPEKSRRIVALIDALDEIGKYKYLIWHNKSGTYHDPIVDALMREGDDLIDPLLDCMEHDMRLMCTSGYYPYFSRDYNQQDRGLISVSEGAYILITNILRTKEFGGGKSEDMKQSAARIRAYWNLFRNMPIEERWYQILADDQATEEQWLDAASSIIAPSNIEIVPLSRDIIKKPLKLGEEASLRGEVLRINHEPSVTALLLKRAEALLALAKDDGKTADSYERACLFANDLAAWDPAAAIPVLRKVSEGYREMVKRDIGYGHYLSPFLDRYSRMIVTRARCGDRGALDEYAARVPEALSPKLNYTCPILLEPFWRYPTHLGLEETAKWLFTGNNSPWQTSLESFITRSWYDDPVQTPLLGLPAFRSFLYTVLADTEAIGKVNYGNGRWSLDYKDITLNERCRIHDPLMPKERAALPVRRCDAFAWRLSKIDGMPDFRLYWPEKERNLAIAAQIAYLKKFGDRYQYDPIVPTIHFNVNDRGRKARPGFPALGRPANKKDVAAGKAIFSLDGSLQVRTVSLHYPLHAKWLMLKKYPLVGWDGNPIEPREYDQVVLVWQGEERFRNSRWERFYGIVGPHEVERVPASEIEFIYHGNERGSRLDSGLDCILHTEDSDRPEAGVSQEFRMILFNSQSVDQKVPTDLCRPELALRQGIKLHLQYSPKIYEDGMVFTEMAPRLSAHFTPNGATRMLAPAESFTAFTVHPAEWFDFSRPGLYRFWLEFTAESGLGTGVTEEIEFSVPRKNDDRRE